MSTRSLILGVPLALALAGNAGAQAEARTYRIEPGARAFTFLTNEDGDWDMSAAMSRRLTRELAKKKAGDEVELNVYSGGQLKTVKLKTIAADDLYRTTRRVSPGREDDRAVLGVSLGSSGSKRDTLGVLLVGIDDTGPAGKAGLEEGNRIQTINGVDLRVSREDAGDAMVGSSKVRRLQRELEKAKAGDEVSLKVYVGGGRTRDLKVKTVPMSDLEQIVPAVRRLISNRIII